MGIFTCDKEKCERKPFREVFFNNEEDSAWCYACFWHYLKLRILRLFKKTDFGWCKVDTDREAIERLLMEITDVQHDLIEIKQKLGIKDETLEEFERNLDVT